MAASEAEFHGYDPDWRTKCTYCGPRCPRCRNWIGNGQEQQVQHVLNGCRAFETQGRYEWRHRAVLSLLDSLMDRSTLTVYADLPGAGRRTESGGTVPEQLLPTMQSKQQKQPDMVFFSRNFDDSDSSAFVVGIVEVTIPWDGRVEAARAEKRAAYGDLVDAISAETQTPVRYVSIEIGSFDQRMSDGSRDGIRELHAFTDGSLALKAFRRSIARTVEAASFRLAATRNEPEWIPPSDPLLDMMPDEDNVSSESEPVGEEEEEATSPPPPPMPEEEVKPRAFSLRSKIAIGASVGAAAGYVVYNYWHVIILAVAGLVSHRVWRSIRSGRPK